MIKNIRYRVALDFSELSSLQDRQEIIHYLRQNRETVTFVWDRMGETKELSIDTRQSADHEEHYARSALEQMGGFRIARILKIEEIKKQEEASVEQTLKKKKEKK